MGKVYPKEVVFKNLTEKPLIKAFQLMVQQRKNEKWYFYPTKIAGNEKKIVRDLTLKRMQLCNLSTLNGV